MVWYATCADGAYSEATETCAQVVYVDVVPSQIPALSREEGAQLGGAVFSLLFIAWAFRFLRRRSP